MPATVHLRHKKVAADSKKAATLLIRELSDDKVKVAIPFLEFLKFLDQNSNGKDFDVTDSIKTGIQELAQLKAGNLKTKSFQALLNEL